MAYHNIYLQRTDKYNQYIVHLWDDKLGHRQFNWSKTAFVPDPAGTHVTLNGKRVSKKVVFSKDIESYEFDVPNEMKLLVEMYGDTDDAPAWQNKFYFDIEVSMEGAELPNAQTGNNPITSIAYYDQTTDEWGVYILDEEGELGADDITDDYKLFVCQTEEELLEKFVNKWQECAPTIVTGWNVDGFDIPYLYNRLKVVFDDRFAKKLSPINEVDFNKRLNKFQIAGLSVLDYIKLYKQFTYTQLSSYRLDFVGDHELGYGKVEYEGTLDDLKRNDIRKFIEYNLVDVKIVKELEDKMKLMDLAVDISHVGHTNYEDIDQSSRWLDGAILCYLRRNGNRVALNKPKLEEGEGSDGFAGAFVKEPIPGRYDYIYDLDLTSMYPSIIMSLNISPETKFGRVRDWDFEKFNKKEISEIEVEILNSNETVILSRDEFAEMLADTGHALSTNGILYRTDIDGVLPAILRDWFDKRSEYKTLMKKFGNEGVDDKYRFYKQRQLIQKVLLNSIYGCLGLKGWRWYDLDNALAVTSVGQQVIKFSSDIANHFYIKETGEKQDYVIYTDTDSTFLSAVPIIKKRYPEIDIDDEQAMCDKIAVVAGEVQQYINKSYDVMAKRIFNITDHRFEIKQENIARRGIWIKKKRYVQKIIWENGVTVDDIDVKGLDVKRSDFPKAFKLFMTEILEDFLNGVEKNIISNKINDFKDSMKQKDFMEICKPTGVKGLKKYRGDGDFGSTAKSTPVHVKSALYYNDFLKLKGLDKKYTPIKSGEKIVWVYLKNNPYGLATIALKGMDDPEEILELVRTYIDYDKMFESLKKKLDPFYEALKWESYETVNTTADKFFSF